MGGRHRPTGADDAARRPRHRVDHVTSTALMLWEHPRQAGQRALEPVAVDGQAGVEQHLEQQARGTAASTRPAASCARLVVAQAEQRPRRSGACGESRSTSSSLHAWSRAAPSPARRGSSSASPACRWRVASITSAARAERSAGLLGRQVVERRSVDLGEPAIQPLDHRFGHEVVLRAEVVGDRREIGPGLLGDRARGDALGRQALEAAERALDQVRAVAVLGAHGIRVGL